jgi:2'-5' RNA ligase
LLALEAVPSKSLWVRFVLAGPAMVLERRWGEYILRATVNRCAARLSPMLYGGLCGLAEAPRQRLFFALWPDEEVRGQLASYRSLLKGCGGRPVVAENLHITLAFLGSVDAATRGCLEQVAEAISLPSFTLQLNELGFWRRPQVVWLGAEHIPEPLFALAAGLKQAMLDCAMEPESRPFQAHLTLMRRARRGPRQGEVPPLSWPVGEFALVVSDTRPEGVRYEVLRKWKLKG